MKCGGTPACPLVKLSVLDVFKARNRSTHGRTFRASREEAPAIFEEFARHFEQLFRLIHLGWIIAWSLRYVRSVGMAAGPGDDVGW